jgi:hypothetical protein
MKLTSSTTSTLIPIFILLATLTTALPTQLPKTPSSLSPYSLSYPEQETTNADSLLSARSILGKRADGTAIGVGVGVSVGILILLGLLCWGSMSRG